MIEWGAVVNGLNQAGTTYFVGSAASAYARPQQLPGPAHVDGGPSLPQQRSAGLVGNLPVGLTAA